MTSKYEPNSGGALVNRLADTVEDHEVRIKGLHRLAHDIEGKVSGVRGELEGLKETVADLFAEEDDKAKQRNWFTVDNPEVAVAWLADLYRWIDQEFKFQLDLPIRDCWPWHPRAVRDLLALQAQSNAAYKAKVPSGVSDLLSRWLPNTLDRLNAEFETCTGGHLGKWRVDTDAGEQLAYWWVQSRSGTPPGLTEL